jgi:pimeloyl-ACP methyl ester carboxylesterase
MATLNKHTFTVKGAPAAVLRTEHAGEPLVFVHGGIAGSSPYCSGSHIWGPVLDRFAATRGVLAVDLPGHGESAAAAPPTMDASVAWLGEALAALGVARCFVVGHDLGGLIALELAARFPALVRGLGLVSSVVAAPTGDGVENLTLAYPPAPLWSRQSQRWAFEQLSYAPGHITDELLDHCVSAAQQPSHRAAVAAMREGALANEVTPSVMQAKARFYELCRGDGVPVPVQVIWGSHERLGSLDQGMWLYRLVAARQTAAQFHVINRVGSFPFREDPQAFHQLIDSFCEAVFPRGP